ILKDYCRIQQPGRVGWALLSAAFAFAFKQLKRDQRARPQPTSRAADMSVRPTQAPQKEKTAGPTSRRSALNLAPLLTAVDRFLEFGSGRKLGDFPSSDLDGGARLRVAPVAGFSLRDGERAKTNQRYSIPLLQSRRDAVDSGVDSRGCRGLTDVAAS